VNPKRIHLCDQADNLSSPRLKLRTKHVDPKTLGVRDGETHQEIK